MKVPESRGDTPINAGKIGVRKSAVQKVGRNSISPEYLAIITNNDHHIGGRHSFGGVFWTPLEENHIREDWRRLAD